VSLARLRLKTELNLHLPLYTLHATGAPAIDQVPRQVSDPTPKRADGSVREVGPVSARNV